MDQLLHLPKAHRGSPLNKLWNIHQCNGRGEDTKYYMPQWIHLTSATTVTVLSRSIHIWSLYSPN